MSSDVHGVEEPADAERTSRPSVLVFDVNETLSDMAGMAERFEDVGAPGHLGKAWFAGVLRDGFALAAVGESAPFATIATENIRQALHGLSLTCDLSEAVEHVTQGFGGLPLHADVSPGTRALSGMGIRLTTLSNGAASVASGLLERAGIRDRFERLLTVEDAGVWKPAAGAYAHAVEQCGVEPGDAMLVAAHPWDIDGARRAGLATAWVNRAGGPYPTFFEAPEVEVGSITELAERLA